MLPLVDLHSQLDEALNINNSDSRFDPRYYTDLINEQRALWIRNEYNKKRTIDPSLNQTIPCMEVELVEPHGCCESIPVGCKILRTKEQLPNTIELFHSKTITSVGPIIMTEKRFSLIEYNRVPYVGYGRTTAKAIYAFEYDNYLYIFSRDPMVKMLTNIAVRGIFEDPTALAEITDCTNGGSCWTPDSPYPLNQWMWAYIKPQIIQSLLQKAQIPQDDNNNTNDDLGDGRGAPVQQAK